VSGRIPMLFARQWWDFVENVGQLIEELLRDDPLGLFLSATTWCGDVWKLRPIHRLHLSGGELAQRIQSNLRDDRLYCLRVLGCGLLEDARNHDASHCAGMEDAGDAAGHCTIPSRSGQEIEARLGVVHLAKLGEGVCALVDDLVDPETVLEVRHLD